MSSEDSKNIPLDENARLPSEDEIEYQANNGKSLYRFVRVAKAERKMFWIMALMFFFISFIYSVARVFKDSAVLGRQHFTSIQFLKFFVILPLSVISVGVIQKYLDKYPFSKIFNAVLIIFGVSFCVLSVLLFNNKHTYILLRPFWARDKFADAKCVVKGIDFLFGFALVCNEWTSSFIYVLSELFGSLILSYLFMTFANGLNTPGQSARFVPLFYVGANLALFLSGLGILTFNKYKPMMTYAKAQMIFNGFFFVCGILCFVIYALKNYLEFNVTNKPIFVRKTVTKKKNKVKVSFMEGLIEMSKSKLLLNISGIVLFYSISTNVIEGAYKMALTVGAKETGQSKSAYTETYTAFEQLGVAVLVMLLLLTPFPRLVKTKGWIFIAILCPIITLFCTLGTFSLAFFNYPITNGEDNIIFKSLKLNTTTSLIKLENLVGVICVSLMKISKYAAFDITKEALAMQIDGSLRAKYKGIFDGIFGKLGKSFGSIYGLIITGLLQTRDIRKAAPISFCLLICFCVIWFYSVFYLNRKYKESIDNNCPIDIDLFSSTKNKLEKSDSSVATKSVEAEI
ncbi:ADP,ATP carrier protein [Vairimorpha necatrix]|uniref:ADP,ATP carrier protein n=1 Tax=Vairimorpha necatrix TaxID=6039 RepID=A0AAX4JDS5_9MICR